MNKHLSLRFSRASKVLSAVNHRIRLKILDLIQEYQITNVSQLAQIMAMDHEDARHHVLILVRAGIIYKESSDSFYTINTYKMNKIRNIVEQLASPVYGHGSVDY